MLRGVVKVSYFGVWLGLMCLQWTKRPQWKVAGSEPLKRSVPNRGILVISWHGATTGTLEVEAEGEKN